MKSEYINYRLKRARETYIDADYLLQRGSTNSSVNRLYYAAFYATLAKLPPHPKPSIRHPKIQKGEQLANCLDENDNPLLVMVKQMNKKYESNE